ncbi:MAG TPA: TSUP family transporter, partial [Microvirga sp.]|nr:TSUP family transporter [Microvirga sp.]
MEFTTAALLAASGLAAGLVNAIAGGGTFFTFSALVAAGLPPVVANATSAVAVTPANVSSAWAYRR